MPRLFEIVSIENCLPTILESNWYERFQSGDLSSSVTSTEPQNKSFHVVDRTRTAAKCTKMKNARAKRAKLLIFIVKYANL